MRCSLIVMVVGFTVFSACGDRCARLGEKYTSSASDQPLNGLLVVQQGHKVCQHTTRIPDLPEVTMDSPVYLASLSKLFTQVAVLKLIEQGLMHPDSTIDAYRPEFQAAFAHTVTIHQLFHMTAGLPREYDSSNLFNALEFDGAGKAGPAIDGMTDVHLLFEPGSRVEYSNLGYWFLGSIIEQITQGNLHEAFEELIFKPLQMLNSGFDDSSHSILTGFDWSGNRWVSADENWRGRYASGGCYASARDLLVLSTSLLSGEFLKKSTLEFLWDGLDRRVEIYGSLPGHTHFILIDFEANLTAIALHNHTVEKRQVLAEIVNQMEEIMDLPKSTSRGSRKISLLKMEALNLQHPIESAMHSWVNAVVTGHRRTAFKILEEQAVPGQFVPDDPTWEELERLANEWKAIRAAGFRWVRDDHPAGIEVWFVCDGPQKLGVLWIPSDADSTKIGDILIKPDDMVWMGRQF